MTMVQASVYLCIPQFLSSMSCSLSSTGLLMFLVKFTPRYFIFLVAISNRNFFLISVSDVSLLVYKNAFDFQILTLYTAVLPNSFIRSNSFLAESLGFSMYTIMTSANSDRFTSPFSIWMPFIYFSCLIAVARTSNIMLNRSGESRYPCLVSDLHVKAFSFFPLSMMLAVGFSHMAFIMLRYASSIPTLLRVFIIIGCWTYEMLFLHLLI